VVIRYEMIHESRIIPLDGSPHLPQTIRLWNGRLPRTLEGNTLVVDITNYNDKSAIATNISYFLHPVDRHGDFPGSCVVLGRQWSLRS